VISVIVIVMDEGTDLVLQVSRQVMVVKNNSPFAKKERIKKLSEMKDFKAYRLESCKCVGQ
jgi:hypothetical protein